MDQPAIYSETLCETVALRAEKWEVNGERSTVNGDGYCRIVS